MEKSAVIVYNQENLREAATAQAVVDRAIQHLAKRKS